MLSDPSDQASPQVLSPKAFGVALTFLHPFPFLGKPAKRRPIAWTGV